MRDLVIAGGGPVGLATALYAAAAGIDVEVREPRLGTIDKACGEGLMPGTVVSLADLGVNPAGHDFLGIRYVDTGSRAEARFRHGPGRGVRRTSLHSALGHAVQRAGVPIVQAPVRRLRQSHHAVAFDGGEARYLIAADGLHSPVRRELGLGRPVRGPRRYGLRAHVEVAPWSDFVEVHWSSTGEAYVTPVGPSLVNVALLSAERLPFLDLLAGFPELRDRVGHTAWSPVRGAGPLRQRSSQRVAGRVLLVGDASGYVDALTGEGLAVGVAQARAALEAVTSGRPTAYETAWRRITWRHRWLTLALLNATRPRAVRRRLVPAASALPWVFAGAVNQLARPA